jgi:micrococcal nuclease
VKPSLRHVCWTVLCLGLLLATANAHAAGVEATVVLVNDADTITVELKGTEELVRLIGVDAPEMSYSKALKRRAKRGRRSASEEAAAGAVALGAVQGLLRPGEQVRLVWGETRRDRYGRLLAYVYLPDGRMLNGWLISAGYARAYRKFKHKYKTVFSHLEKQAQQNKRGLWAQGGP